MIVPALSRLTARRLADSDFDTLRTMHRDPDVMATLGGLRSDERTRAYLSENLAHWAAHGFGMWIFHERDGGAFVGRGGLRHVVLDGRSDVEVFYALMPKAWGQGYATEIARASIEAAFRQLALRELVAFTGSDNARSRRVMEKVGFVYERDFVYHEERCVLYRLSRP